MTDRDDPQPDRQHALPGGRQPLLDRRDLLRTGLAGVGADLPWGPMAALTNPIVLRPAAPPQEQSAEQPAERSAEQSADR
ncbi:hypothetical protein OG535_06695 [Kitasatospora sp. NBC_00085]|uniref:hypothetical protein n=1 Tax=unclassified Kitasatospora TaxID=2633591 RepID=UPI003247C7F8